eukprot:3697348-Pleurochrysis_carterae.AAC.1
MVYAAVDAAVECVCEGGGEGGGEAAVKAAARRNDGQTWLSAASACEGLSRCLPPCSYLAAVAMAAASLRLRFEPPSSKPASSSSSFLRFDGLRRA